MSENDDGFTLVTSKSRRKATSRKPPTAVADQQGFYTVTKSRAAKPLSLLVDQTLAEIASKRYTLATSGYLAQLASHITLLGSLCPAEIVCFGVGSPTGSQASQWQITLVLEIQDALKPIRVSAYDPVVTDADRRMLDRLDIEVLTENEEGRRVARERTLFFMPHCEQFLYENLVAANWTRETLEKVVVVGNRFAMYRDAQGQEEFARRSPHLDRILRGGLEVVELPSETHLRLKHPPYAFTDTCIQYASSDKLGLIDFSH
ncbi:hypothetical protein LPJ53_005573 [Coemansia erecta]|uniref:SRR1-like domain-containing protein n=1 Tax=Coemansia erecta TaxID=147472 RepID=A0A9W7XXA1_9FUNG|nr:hypothetical protein LPJ53_005573 [Coemansia erecta]